MPIFSGFFQSAVACIGLLSTLRTPLVLHNLRSVEMVHGGGGSSQATPRIAVEPDCLDAGRVAPCTSACGCRRMCRTCAASTRATRSRCEKIRASAWVAGRNGSDVAVEQVADAAAPEVGVAVAQGEQAIAPTQPGDAAGTSSYRVTRLRAA